MCCAVVWVLWRENQWRGRLSETIKAAEMRDSGKEGHYSGERIKEIMRGD
jgi:hypothetical protein